MLVRKAFLLLLCAVLFLSVSVIAPDAPYPVIVGNSIFLEDEQASIRITPHTAFSPVGKYEQQFEVCNKTGIDTILFGAFVFNFDLNSGSVRYWKKPIYDWVSHQFTCNYNFVYKLNVDADRNPHWAKCYKVIDVNGYDENIVYFDGEFKTGTLPTKTITYDVTALVSGNNWLDVTQKFIANKFTKGGKQVYPYLDGLVVKANSCEKWKINYAPSTNDTTKKWEAWLWAGASANCILTDTCTKTLVIDPWWDSDWSNKKPIQFPAQNLEIGTRIRVPINFFTITVQSDLDDVRIVNDSNLAELDTSCEGTNTSTDGNCFFTMPYNLLASDPNQDATYYVYYNNPAAPAQAFGDTADDNTFGFETGQNMDWTLNGCTVEGAAAKFGSLGCTLAGIGDKLYKYVGLGDASPDSNYSFWFNRFGATVAVYFRLGSPGKSPCLAYIYAPTITAIDNGSEITIGTIDAATWYNFQVHYTDNDNSCYWTVREANGNVHFTAKTIAVIGEITTITQTEFYTYGAGDITYLDNVYVGPYFNSSGLGSQEISSSCSCPASGHWNIINDDNCTLSTTCNLSIGSLHIVKGSLTVTATGTLSVPTGQKIIIEKTNGKMVLEKGGKVIIDK